MALKSKKILPETGPGDSETQGRYIQRKEGGWKRPGRLAPQEGGPEQTLIWVRQGLWAEAHFLLREASCAFSLAIMSCTGPRTFYCRLRT